MDDLTNAKDVKKKGGAIGTFTKAEINRTESFEKAVVLALVRFINPEMYNGV